MKATWPALLLTTVLTASTALADAANTVILFSTPGPDKYQDGSDVRDGEYYALVWTAGEAFAGFTATGEAADPAQKVIFKAPLAKDRRCPLVNFQIDSKKAPEGGVYSVYLLDTRASTGESLIVTGLSLAKAYASDDASASNVKTVSEDNATGGLVSTASGLVDEAGLITPTITGFKVVDGTVKITVGNVLPGCVYEVKGGLDKAASISGATFTEAGDKTLEVTVPAPEATFFSIKLK